MSDQPTAEKERKRSALYLGRKSGHYVADPEGPCWCGDVHFYAEEA